MIDTEIPWRIPIVGPSENWVDQITTPALFRENRSDSMEWIERGTPLWDVQIEDLYCTCDCECCGGWHRWDKEVA